MKTIIEKIICILIILIVLFSINTKVYAWSQVFSDAQNFIATGENSNEANVNAVGVQELSSYLYNILLSAGVVIAVIIATVLGIQFMTSSAEGQAKVKEALIPFVVGCIVVFGGFGIWKIGINIGNRIEKAEGETSSCTHSGVHAASLIDGHYQCGGCQENLPDNWRENECNVCGKIICPNCNAELQSFAGRR